MPNRLRSSLLMLLISISLGALGPLARPAQAQGYPSLRDSAHRSVPPPYPWQSPLPLGQQDDPRITPGAPLQTAPGVPNGPPSLAPWPPGVRPPRPAPPPAERTPMGSVALITDPDALAFHADGRLPTGATLATVRALPEGGEELYLRLPEGGRLPASFSTDSLDLTLLRGEASLVIDGRRVPMAAGTHAALPARTAHMLQCSNGSACLLFVHSDGPYRPRPLQPSAAGP